MTSSRQVQWRRGSTLDNDLFTGADGEISVDSTVHTLRVHDGQTQGGFPLALGDLSNVPDSSDFWQKIQDMISASSSGGGATEETLAIGDIKTSFANPGADYVPANGSLINTTDYPALHNSIGTRFGVDSIAGQPIGPGTVISVGTSAAFTTNGLANNGDLVVAALTNGWLAYSTNAGLNWYPINPDGSTVAWTGVAFGAGKFVAVGTNKIATSTDGINWTVNTTVTAIFTAIWYLNNTFFAYAATTSWKSTDGLTWTSFTWTGFTAAIPWVVVYNTRLGLYMAGGASAALYTSPDGVTWTTRTSNMTNGICGLADNGTIVVAVGGNGTTTANIATSPDGITWTAKTNTIAASRAGVVWWAAKSMFVTYGYNGQVATSPDATTWTTYTQANSGNITWTSTVGATIFAPACVALSKDNSTVMVVGTSGWATSTDGVTWTTKGTGRSNATANAGAILSKIAITNTATLFWGGCGVTYSADMGNNGYSVMSTGGGLVTAANVGGARGIATNGTLQVVQGCNQAANNAGDANSSLTGMHVSATIDQFNVVKPCFHGVAMLAAANSVQYFGIKFVVYGNNGGLSTSTDGLTWNICTTFSSNVNITRVAYNGTNYVVVGTAGTLGYSTDGVTWTPVTGHPLGTNTINDVKWIPAQNLFYACGALNNVIMSSPDGITWTSVAIPVGTGPYLKILFNDYYLYLANATTRLTSTPHTMTGWSYNTVPQGVTSILCDAGHDRICAISTTSTLVSSTTYYYPYLFTSLDGGYTWSSSLITATAVGTAGTSSTTLSRICWTGQGWLTIGSTQGSTSTYPAIFSSPNGTVWTQKPTTSSTGYACDMVFASSTTAAVSYCNTNPWMVEYPLAPAGKFRVPAIVPDDSWSPDPYIRAR